MVLTHRSSWGNRGQIIRSINASLILKCLFLLNLLSESHTEVSRILTQLGSFRLFSYTLVKHICAMYMHVVLSVNIYIY